MLISFFVFLFALFLVLGAYLLATHGKRCKARAFAKTPGRSFAAFGSHRRH